MRLGFASAVLIAMLWYSSSAGAQSYLSATDVAPFQGTWVLDLMRSGLTEASSERRVITIDTTSMQQGDQAFPETVTNGAP
jgi:hypothetical protein